MPHLSESCKSWACISNARRNIAAFRWCVTRSIDEREHTCPTNEIFRMTASFPASSSPSHSDHASALYSPFLTASRGEGAAELRQIEMYSDYRKQERKSLPIA